MYNVQQECFIVCALLKYLRYILFYQAPHASCNVYCRAELNLNCSWKCYAVLCLVSVCVCRFDVLNAFTECLLAVLTGHHKDDRCQLAAAAGVVTLRCAVVLQSCAAIVEDTGPTALKWSL